MRKEIRDKLINDIPQIGGRVYEPHAAGVKTLKPYLIIRQGNDDYGAWLGDQNVIEVWPYVARTTFREVDNLAKSVIESLDKRLILTESGEVFTCIYTGSPDEDTVDEDWDACTRLLQFAVLSFPSHETTEPDPVAALNNWVSVKFSSLQLDSKRWVINDDTPAIYWRLLGFSATEYLNTITWAEATLMGHVLAPSPIGRLKWVKKITETMALTECIYLADGSPLFFKSVAADSQADHIKRGQIKLTVKYGLVPEAEISEKLNHIYHAGIIPGQGG
jgi:hypothetical protein